MRLLTLEMEGFKSFAQKTKIDFQAGMNGIIGPNGSGKSNIIEAIRWVMGEQSAKTLRGDKMADVIFNGSTERAPLNRAQVKMTLDNSDHYLPSEYTEITVTRRLYRNGDSEYLINDQAVRLKDIVELFIDSGVGRESFSVISQGQVAAIFNGKPTDRRSVIENVAGVTKYKQNKQAAEKKLATTNDNLNRVNDIISEIQGRLEPLAEQSALAKDYLAQKSRLDLLDRTATVNAITEQRQALVATQDQIADTQTLADQYETAAKQAQQTLQKLQRDVQTVTQQKDDHQHQVVLLTETIAKLNGEQSLATVRQEQFAAEEERLTKEIATVTEQQTQLAQTQAALTNDLTTAQQAVTQSKTDLADLQKLSVAQRRDKLVAQRETWRDELVDQMQALTAAQNQHQYLTKNQAREAAAATQADQESANLTQQLTELTTAVDQQAQVVATTKQVVRELTDQYQAEQAHQRQLQSDYEQVTQQWYQALGEAKSAQNRIQSFQAMAADYTGYYQGVQAVLRQRQLFTGLLGAVSELITVPTAYTTALETVLGSQLQQLVVQTQATGKQIINYLIKQRAGRVTILPMDSLRLAREPRTLAAVAEMDGYVGWAPNLIQFDEQIAGVVKHLLANTVLADNLEHATAIARAGQHQLRVVTLDGQLINASGAMTGGANRNQRTGLLQQKEQLNRLMAAQQQVQQQAQALETKVQRLQTAREQNQTSLNDLQGQLQTAQAEAQAAQTKHQVMVTELNGLKSQLDALTYTLDQQGVQAADYQRQLATAAQAMTTAQQQVDDLQAKLAQVETQITALSTNADDQASQVQTLMQTLAVQEERVRHTKQQLTQLTSQQTQLADRLGALNEQVAQLKQQAQHQVDHHASNADGLATAKASLAQHQAALDELNAQAVTLNDQLARQATDNERRESLSRAALDELANHKATYAKLQTQIDQGLNKLSEQYHMTFTDAQQNLSDLPADELARQIKLLKLGIAELGEVNTASIAEYEDVKTRYDFLHGQQVDLMTAREQLMTTMAEMDAEVSDRFMAMFKEVSIAFTETFKQIFAGGTAKLVLNDPSDPLTTGVDIIAQPPGKRNQNLSLLSGGEQALTAITLLFAIIKVRPVPFAILDEPEAALDAVNVDRFANYLGTFGPDGPQFIVITHRKGTMMNANILYGVTMQESGVSRMVAIDIDETLGAPAAE
ncbi:chromosome segregation protein SMC [Limosilactobacillus equigenerosi]|uniref:chromosome segregation protein SMC n=1 Tax=Limosilactobacillus equigenerosi TaxID=417373 RepID=UPI00077472C7|nr:chromosome segregation protein SMC [Limosilactobacillus equigenerosi]